MDSRSSTMLRNWRAFVSSIQMTWSSRIPWKTRAKSWGCVWNPPRLAKFKTFGTVKPVAKTNPSHADQKYACILDANETTRKGIGHLQQKDHEDHIAGRGVQFVDSLQSCAQIYSYAPSENPVCESRCWQRIGKARKIASMAHDQSKEQKRMSSKKHKKIKEQSILLRWWTSVQRLGCTPKWQCERRFWI